MRYKMLFLTAREINIRIAPGALMRPLWTIMPVISIQLGFIFHLRSYLPDYFRSNNVSIRLRRSFARNHQNRENQVSASNVMPVDCIVRNRKCMRNRTFMMHKKFLGTGNLSVTENEELEKYGRSLRNLGKIWERYEHASESHVNFRKIKFI